MDIFAKDDENVRDPEAEAENEREPIYNILDFAAQLPGWYAAYDQDPDQPDGATILRPICGLARVKLEDEHGEPIIAMRHLAAAVDGEIHDVEDFPGFVCVVGPGQNPNLVIPAVRHERARTASGNSKSSRIVQP